MSTSSDSSGFSSSTKTLPRIGGSHRNTEIWKYRISKWFQREGVTFDNDRFSYIISSNEDDTVRV